MESGLSDYNLDPAVIKRFEEEEWNPIFSRIGEIIPGSQIYVPGIGVRDITSGEQLTNAVFGFFRLGNRIIEGFQNISGSQNQFLISDHAVVITNSDSVIQNLG